MYFVNEIIDEIGCCVGHGETECETVKSTSWTVLSNNATMFIICKHVQSLDFKMSLTIHLVLLVCSMFTTELDEFPLHGHSMNLDYFEQLAIKSVNQCLNSN